MQFKAVFVTVYITLNERESFGRRKKSLSIYCHVTSNNENGGISYRRRERALGILETTMTRGLPNNKLNLFREDKTTGNNENCRVSIIE